FSRTYLPSMVPDNDERAYGARGLVDGSAINPPREFSGLSFHWVRSGGLVPELFGEPDQDSLGASNVAEPVDIFVVDHLIDHCGTELAEPSECVVEVLDGEHHSQVAKRVHRRGPVIGRDGRSVEA